MRYRLATAVVVGLLMVTSGCMGFSASGDQSPTERSKSSPTATCHDNPAPYTVSVPSKPETLTEETASEVVKTFDKRYERAKAKDDYDNITVDTSVRAVDVQPIDDGFEVTITMRVQISGNDLHGKWAYPTTYQITNRSFEREGSTLDCW